MVLYISVPLWSFGTLMLLLNSVRILRPIQLLNISLFNPSSLKTGNSKNFDNSKTLINPFFFNQSINSVESSLYFSNFDYCSIVRGIFISSNLIFIFSAAFKPLLKNKPQKLKKIIKMYFTCD